MLPKDLLNIIFWELTDGHDMLNFSEINRVCHQIFRRNIDVIQRYNAVKMINCHGDRHGISQIWYMHDSALGSKNNYYQGYKHGVQRGWHPNGKKWWVTLYQYNKRHGEYIEWSRKGKLLLREYYHHGKQIEK